MIKKKKHNKKIKVMQLRASTMFYNTFTQIKMLRGQIQSATQVTNERKICKYSERGKKVYIKKKNTHI